MTNSSTSNPQLSADSQSLFLDLRQTLNGSPSSTEETEILAVVSEKDDSVTEEILQDDWRKAEASFRNIPGTQETPAAPAKPQPSTRPPQPPPNQPGGYRPGNGSPRPNAYGFTPQPTPPVSYGNFQSPRVNPQPTMPSPSRKTPVRVGLLVWAGILVILGVLVASTLFLPGIDGITFSVVLFGAFGLILVIAALASSARSSRQQQRNEPTTTK